MKECWWWKQCAGFSTVRDGELLGSNIWILLEPSCKVTNLEAVQSAMLSTRAGGEVGRVGNCTLHIAHEMHKRLCVKMLSSCCSCRMHMEGLRVALNLASFYFKFHPGSCCVYGTAARLEGLWVPCGIQGHARSCVFVSGEMCTAMHWPSCICSRWDVYCYALTIVYLCQVRCVLLCTDHVNTETYLLQSTSLSLCS
jgi:hypothetical protein